MKYDIPFNRPYRMPKGLDNIVRAIESGHISGDGEFTQKCTKFLEKVHPSSSALLTTSCTHALEMAAMLLNVQAGDEILVPSFTFVSTINAFVLRGARPVFVDIRPDTLNIDEEKLEQHITHKTKAIVPVHYAGVGCEMDKILALAAAYKIEVIEDNAHGLLGRYKERTLGTFGAMSSLSFHETKNFQCGEGGALIINDSSLVERAEIIREKGTNRKRYFRGQVDKYSWVDIGSSYLLSDILAAYLYAQFEHADEIAALRKKIWKRYENKLADWANEYNVGLPFCPSDRESPHHIFYLLMPSASDRQKLIAHLEASRISAVHHYVPLHTSEMGVRYGYKKGDLPVTETTSDCLVRLPLFNDLTDSQQTKIIDSVCAFKTEKMLTKPGYIEARS
jgi:dTDP-4-amino-4,6-dideoxygalactose transaminase